MKNNLYLVQFNHSYGKGLIMPYSVGVIWAYASQFPSIQRAYELKDIICIREEPDDIVANLKSPDVVAFSVSVWNFEISLAVAEKIKDYYPDCLVIFGGPHVPNKVGDFFNKHPFIDILVHGEGEVTFYKILEKKANISFESELKGVKGASFNNNNGDGYGYDAVVGLGSVNATALQNYMKGQINPPTIKGIITDILGKAGAKPSVIAGTRAVTGDHEH